MRWMLNGPGLETLTTDATARRFFSGARPLIVTGPRPIAAPPEWGAIRVQAFTRYADLARAFERGRIDARAGAILYDNEGWRFTPAEEQSDPAFFMGAAGRAVRKNGLLFITAPAVTIAKLRTSGNAKPYAAYLQAGLAAAAARCADIFDIQAQGSERNVDHYASFVAAAAAQARAANPAITVLAGISTNPNGQRVSADHILAAIEATRTHVDGYWLNIPKPGVYCPNCSEFRPDIAIDVLHGLSRPS